MSRVPPHDAAAEQDCIAALLTQRAAGDAVFAVTTGLDFYVPRNQHIVSAIEDLWRAGRLTDETTVAAKLAEQRFPVRRDDLRQLVLAASPSLAPEAYALVVAERAACRRLIRKAGAVAEAAWDGRMDSAVLADQEAVGLPQTATDAGLDLDELLASVEPPYNWAIEGLLCFGERLILTGSEGGGKTTLLRQIAACAAAGVHPFAGFRTKRRRTLYVDLQDTRDQNRREYRRPIDYLRKVNAWDSSYFRLYIEGRGIDLTTAADAAWLRDVVEKHKAEVLCIGPMYKAFRGNAHRSKDSEESVDIVQDVLDRIIAGCGLTILMEGHAPYGEHGDRAGFRMRGSSAWLGWPDFMIGLKRISKEQEGRPAVGLERPRLDRDRSRTARWPTRLLEGNDGQLPWVPPLEERGQKPDPPPRRDLDDEAF